MAMLDPKKQAEIDQSLQMLVDIIPTAGGQPGDG